MVRDFSASLRAALARLSEDDEWAVSRARDAALHGLSPSEAFESIVEVLSLAADQNDPYAFAVCCEAALELAKLANTTERPPGLELTLARIEPHGQLLGCAKQLGEIRAWFRIAA